MPSENVEAFRRLTKAGNDQDFDAVLEGVTEDVEWIAARSAVEGTFHGHDGMRRFFADNLATFEVFRGEFDEVRDLGDNRLLVLGLVHVRVRGGGVEMDNPAAGIATYRNGKLARWEDFRERTLALEAAGLPTTGSEG